MRTARDSGRRVALFGALLARETALEDRLVLVGGLAIAVYTEGAYVSEDVDVVGGRTRIGAALRRWGFEWDAPYWRRDDLRLLVQPARDRYVGNSNGLTTLQTSHGPVTLAAIEDLLVRRLVYAKSRRDPRFIDEAALLITAGGETLDPGYLQAEVRYERVELEYREAQRRAARRRTPRSRTFRHRRSLKRLHVGPGAPRSRAARRV